MNQFDIVNYYNLKLGDRLIREKGIFSKHHGIFVGIHNGLPFVAENNVNSGVQYVTLADFLLNRINNLSRIERFKGTEQARKNIIPRINNLLGTRYGLVNFNCEHFAELIQNGKPKSKQLTNALLGFAIGYVVISAIKNN